MTAKVTLNARNLERLGAAKLAELLLEISAGNAAAKRRLRLELAGLAGPSEAAGQVRKRLTSIARARSWLDADQRRALIFDLDAQRRAIVETVARGDPPEALDLLWRFLGLAAGLAARTDDRTGTLEDVFETAIHDLAPLLEAVRPAPEHLATDVAATVLAQPFGRVLLETVRPALDAAGVARLRTLLEEAAGEGGERSARPFHARVALRDLADLEGDVAAFVAQYDARARRSPPVAAEIAERWLAVGQPDAALAALDAADHGPGRYVPFAFEDVRARVLAALGRSEEARALRWTAFARTLDAHHLRAHLRDLPDFEDDLELKRAFEVVLAYRDVHRALDFLVEWPALRQAERLVMTRAAAFDGDRYDVLAPAAEVLAAKYPTASVILHRKMIDFALDQARSKRYGHAARHLAASAELDARLDPEAGVEPHAAYLERLRARHGRKLGFWAQVVLSRAGP
ncbi:MAG: DUF6880 family protein [Pseudomonadota bacterium]